MLSTVQTYSVSEGINNRWSNAGEHTHIHTSWLVRAEQRETTGGDETPTSYAYHLDLEKGGGGGRDRERGGGGRDRGRGG